MRRGVARTLAGAVAMGALAACTSTTVADEVYPGVPDGVDLVGEALQGPSVGWIEPGERFAIVTSGSSSCPAVATELAVVSPAGVSVTFGDSPNDQCTADIAPTTHEFDLPTDVVERPVQIEVSHEDGGEAHTFTLN